VPSARGRRCRTTSRPSAGRRRTGSRRRRRNPCFWQYSPIPGRSFPVAVQELHGREGDQAGLPVAGVEEVFLAHLPPRGIIRTSTLRVPGATRVHVGRYSTFAVTRLSPSFQGKPAATKESPRSVLHEGISSGRATIRANRPGLVASSSHFRRRYAPRPGEPQHGDPGLGGRHRDGRHAAWFRYRKFSVTGNSAARIGSTSIGKMPSSPAFSGPVRLYVIIIHGLVSENTLRYSRNILVEELGEAGQERLFASSVLVVGAGGWGRRPPLSRAAGIGRIGVIDDDRVDISNFKPPGDHRPTPWAMEGRLRGRGAAGVPADLAVDVYPETLTARMPRRCSAVHAIVDGSDQLLHEVPVQRRGGGIPRPLVHAGVLRFAPDAHGRPGEDPACGA